MKNGIVLLAVGLSVAAFGGMMRIKTDVQQLVRERGRLATTQLQLKETKRVLEAEYAMLASPLRLAALAKTRGFGEMTITQVVPMDPRDLIPPTAVATDAATSLLSAQPVAAGMGRSAALQAGGTAAAPVAVPAAKQPGPQDAVVGSVPATPSGGIE